ncbi:hypothetical protein [Reticulibacter mediterranei]|uniref:hypothetical protein n=1 Tax=Reticulibacter mediterranei TaxID=2778369 RepID=UPI001C690631|nr:hypothetical protein [Reticulibacter mediterranei]
MRRTTAGEMEETGRTRAREEREGKAAGRHGAAHSSRQAPALRIGLGTDNQMDHKVWDGQWLPSPTDWEALGGVFHTLSSDWFKRRPFKTNHWLAST